MTVPPVAAERLSINQITVKSWSFEQTVRGLARHGLHWVGAWLDPVVEYGVDRAAKLLVDHDVKVSSVCRAGFFTGVNPDGGGLDREANRRAVDITAALGADVLYLVSGGVMADHDLAGSRSAVRDGVGELVEHASAAGVRLAVEPLHPMMCAERSVVVSMREANTIAEAFSPSEVGVAVDTYNVWWDPELASEIARAGERVISYQVCDWLVPQPHPLWGRGLPGDGVIDIASVTRAVSEAGYRGPIEVEIFNESIWSSDPDVVVGALGDRFERFVLGLDRPGSHRGGGAVLPLGT